MVKHITLWKLKDEVADKAAMLAQDAQVGKL